MSIKFALAFSLNTPKHGLQYSSCHPVLKANSKRIMATVPTQMCSVLGFV